MKTQGSDFVFRDKGSAYGGGLTKREYFAAAAFQGLLSDSDTLAAAGGAQPSVKAAYKNIAGIAVLAADMLIEELNNKDVR